MIRRSLLVAAVLVLVAQPAHAAGVNDLPPVTDDQIASSVENLTLPVANLTLPVSDVDTRSTDGGQTVVSLKSDILFAFGRSDLSSAAKTRIAGLVADVKKNANVKVYGYTDNIGSSSSNQRLSQARARSVAAAIAAVRADLKLSEHGYGEAHPVAPNTKAGQDDPVGRAKNRRVEIRF